MATAEIIMQARKTLEQNKECFVAQWILQNRGEDIASYELVEMTDWAVGVYTFSIRRKDELLV